MALRAAASFGAGAAAITASNYSIGDTLWASLGFGGVEKGADDLAKAMQRQVETLEARLEKVLSSAPPPAAAPPVMIIREGGFGGRSTSEWLVLAGGAAAAWLAYCRLTGRRPLSPLAALLPVSRAALAQSCAAIDAGVRGVSDAVGRVRDRLHELTGTVQAGLEEQAAMRGELGAVADEVAGMRGSVEAMHASVKQCDARLVEAAQQQEFANNGIQLLCSVVHDVIQPAGGANMIGSRERLRLFAQGGTQPALAEDRATGTAQLGLLLGAGGGGAGASARERAVSGDRHTPAPSDMGAGAPHTPVGSAPASSATTPEMTLGTQLRMLARIGSHSFGGGDASGGGKGNDSDADQPGGRTASGSSLSSATSDD